MSVKCPHCNKDITEHIGKLFGSLGGQATKKKGKKYFSEIGKKGMRHRWSKEKSP